MFITQIQKEQTLKKILKEFISTEILSEMVLKDIVYELIQQLTAKKSPTMDGLGKRDTDGFWNMRKHMGDMVRAGISPELEKVGMNEHKMLVALFKTKSHEHVVKKGTELKEYYQKLVFTDWPLLSQNPQLTIAQKITLTLKGNIEIYCSCKSDNYHYGYARNTKQMDLYLDPEEVQSQKAPIRNPDKFGVGCKHLGMIFLPANVQKKWGPLLLQKVIDLLGQDKSPEQIKTREVPFGPPQIKKREPMIKPDEIVPEPEERQSVMEPSPERAKKLYGPLQQDKYGQNIVPRTDPRWGKPGYRGPDIYGPKNKPPGYFGPREPPKTITVKVKKPKQ